MEKTKHLVVAKPVRVFSNQLKKKIVSDIETGKIGVSGVSREYQVARSAIYQWLKEFSGNLHTSTRVVMQMDSEQYRTKELEKRVSELEAALGRKQMEVD